MSLVPFHATQLGFIALGACVLGVSMLVSFVKSIWIITRNKDGETQEETVERNEEASHIQFAGFVNSIGFTTYLMLLAGYGRIISNGEEFFYIQYVEWIICTPLMIMNTANLLSAPSAMVTSVMLFDVLMIINGFCASVSSTITWRYTFYSVSSFYFVAIFYLLFHQKKIISVTLKDYPDVVSVFNSLMRITVMSWAVYPLLFLFGPNGSILTGTTGFLEVAVCLDVGAKGLWGFLQTINSRALKDAMDKYESKQYKHNMMLSCLISMGCIEQDIVNKLQSPVIDAKEDQSDLMKQFIEFQQFKKNATTLVVEESDIPTATAAATPTLVPAVPLQHPEDLFQSESVGSNYLTGFKKITPTPRHSLTVTQPPSVKSSPKQLLRAIGAGTAPRASETSL